MRIALIVEWLDAWRGGAEKSSLQFVHHLMEQGVEVHVFTRSRPSPAPGLYVHTIHGASMSRTRRSATFAHRVERRLLTESYDVIHAISPCRGADLYQPRGGTVAETIERNLAIRRSPAGRSLKRCANRVNFKQRYLLGLERELMTAPNGPVIIAISDYVIRQLRRHYSVPAERIRKIYNGVDVDTTPIEARRRDRAMIRKEFGIREDACLVLTIAHNFRLKGVQRWMEALAALLRQGVHDIRSLVVGKGESERWHRLAARLGIAEHLTFIGRSDRVPALHHAADMLVHPTYYDPCSRVVLEALTAGLPCVTTTWDGAAETIEDGVNGFVLSDPWDTAALVDRVDRLRDAALRQRMSSAAAAVGPSVSMARHAEDTLELYGEFLAPVPR